MKRVIERTKPKQHILESIVVAHFREFPEDDKAIISIERDLLTRSGAQNKLLWMWNKIRVDFPEQFDAYAKMERERGYTILKDKDGALYLDELDPNRGRMSDEPKIECGIMCEIAETTYTG